jgi:phosphoenolpyruvate carboxylase
MDKQELPINNSAERLYVILTRAAESSGNSLIVDVLCTAMNLEPNNENFIKGFTELLVLLEKTEEQIQQYCSHRKKSAYLRSMQEIKKYLLNALKLAYKDNNQNLWSSANCLNDPNWTFLESLGTCIEDFEESGIIIKKDILHDLINDVNTWMKEISQSQLDEDIKEFFIQKLIEIEILLKNYCYHSSSRINKEFLATIMEISIYQANLTEDKKEKNKSFFNTFLGKLLTWAGKLEPLISLAANGSPMILQGINILKNLLPPGS